MALHADTVWEVRTTGSQTNGGGFHNRTDGTSVDYSQQDAAQLSLTDIATDAAGTEVSSTTGGFTAAMVGNIIYLVGGGATAGWYEITAHSDTNTVTIDSSAGANKSSVTGKVGGAFLMAGSNTAEFFSATHGKAAGNIIHIKTGTYAVGETLTFGSVAGLLLIGYKTTRWDTPTENDRPTINMSSYAGSSSQATHMRNLIWTGTQNNAATNGVWKSSAQGVYVNCKFANTTATADKTALVIEGNSIFIGCEMTSTLGQAVYVISGNSKFLFCYIHDSVTGVSNAGIHTMYGCVIDTCTTGANFTGNGTIEVCINNTIYGCGTGIVEDVDTSSAQEIVRLNNIISDCTTGLNATGTQEDIRHYVDFNCWNNTTDISGDQLKKGDNVIEEDPEMTSPATGNFSIDNDSAASNEGLDCTDYSGCNV